jgi:hypothetical protein
MSVRFNRRDRLKGRFCGEETPRLKSGTIEAEALTGCTGYRTACARSASRLRTELAPGTRSGTDILRVTRELCLQPPLSSMPAKSLFEKVVVTAFCSLDQIHFDGGSLGALGLEGTAFIIGVLVEFTVEIPEVRDGS